MDPRQVLEAARKAIEAGESPDVVAQWVQKATGKTLQQLAGEMQGGPPAGSTGRGAVSDFLRMAGQGATLGFGDELTGVGAAMVPGGKGYREATDASRERLSGIRGNRPGLALAGELAGGLLLPAGALGAGAKAGMTAGKAVLGGMAVGGLTAGLYGAGEATGGLGERLGAAALPAAGGAAVGAFLPAAGAVARNTTRAFQRTGERELAGVMAGRGPRVSSELQRTSGLDNDIRAAMRSAQERIDAARAEYYKPLEEAYPAVSDQNLLATLRSPDFQKFTRAHAPGVVEGGEPSLQQLQKLRMALRNGAQKDPGTHALLTEMETLMQKAVPELKDADAAYAIASGHMRAIEAGRKMAGKSSADIKMMLETLPPETHESFSRGMLHEIVTKLEKRDTGVNSAGTLRNFLDAGPETKAVLRSVFPSDEAFRLFEVVLKRETTLETAAKNAIQRQANVRNAWKLLAASAGATGTAGVVWKAVTGS